MSRTETTGTGVVACTLFEGSFGDGVAALANSLYASGFRGDLVAGYRGPLPSWAEAAVAEGPQRSRMTVAEGMSLVFVELDTPSHFTVYKPVFMNYVMEEAYPAAIGVIYVDPDIVFKAKWWFLEEWLQAGVALVEDINSPFSLSHPKRAAWRALCEKCGYRYAPKEAIYVNGGYVGVLRKHKTFIEIWSRLLDAVREVNPDVDRLGMSISDDPNYNFKLPDQDCLNMAAGIYPEVATVGREGMDFAPGGNIMSHAIGGSKPWDRNFLRLLFKEGKAPRTCDREFWRHAHGPIELYSPKVIKRRLRDIKLAAALGRVVGK